MPLFDFKCGDGACGHVFEKIAPATTQQAECPECGALADKQLSAPSAPQFKGTGFYQTDFKGK